MSNAVWYALIVVALVVGIAVGYVIAPMLHKPAPPTSAPFAVGAAGTLKFAFTDILNEMQSLYPSIKVAPPFFKGSGEVAQKEVTTGVFSVVASADTTTIPSVLFKNNVTDYEIAFGVTQMVVIVDLNSTYGREVYDLWEQAQSYQPFSAQWNETWRKIFDIIAFSPAVVGVSNPFTDPSGYQAICVVKLAGLAFFNNENYLFNAIYGNSSKYIMRNTEIDLLTLMEAGQVQFILSAYTSNAIPQTKEYRGTAYITLPPMVNLGDLSYVNYYHLVNFTWSELGVTKSFICNPVVYTITIPKNAPNREAAVDFMLLLFSPMGQRILEENGITPIVPGIVYGNYSSVPAILRAFTAPVSEYPQYASIFPG